MYYHLCMHHDELDGVIERHRVTLDGGADEQRLRLWWCC
jgi:hypothetical protein